MIEIAKIYNIEYEPDPQVMNNDSKPDGIDDGELIDFQDRNNFGRNDGNGGGAPQPIGFIGFPQPPSLPVMPQVPQHKPFNYPGGSGSGGSGGSAAYCPTAPYNYNIPPHPHNDEKKDLNINSNFLAVSCI